MTGTTERDAHPHNSPFAGLRPTRLSNEAVASELAVRERNRFARSMLNTVPIVLVGSLAVAGLNITGALDSVDAEPSLKPKAETFDLSQTVKDALAEANKATAANVDVALAPGPLSTASSAPSTYRVQGGDTVSSIAGQYGLSTASVLALNGLGWKSVIFPGQVLKLTNAVVTPVAATSIAAVSSTSGTRYTIAKGDTVSSIATKFGVSVSAVLSANGLDRSSTIYAGRTLNIPGGDTAAITVAAPTAVAASVTTSAPSSNGSRYTIKSGDTVTAIAKQFGISVQALLDANGLNRSSIIFSDQNLTIPGASGSLQTASASPSVAVSSAVTGLSAEASANARTIVRVGQSLGVPDYGIVIALAAAMQESSLRNLSDGDRDSVGLFQQRPSTGWGSVEQLRDAEYSAKLFYGGKNNPNKGYTRGLLDIAGWESMSVSAAAQKVQISGHPNAYAQWESSARSWFAELR